MSWLTAQACGEWHLVEAPAAALLFGAATSGAVAVPLFCDDRATPNRRQAAPTLHIPCFGVALCGNLPVACMSVALPTCTRCCITLTCDARPCDFAASLEGVANPALLRIHLVTLDTLLRGVLLLQVPVFRSSMAPAFVCSLLWVRRTPNLAHLAQPTPCCVCRRHAFPRDCSHALRRGSYPVVSRACSASCSCWLLLLSRFC